MASGVIIPVKSHLYRHSMSNLTFTAGSGVDLGTISSLTNGDYTNGNNIKNMTIVYAGGATAMDLGTLAISYTTQKLYYIPSITQNSGFITFVLEFE